MEFQNPEGLVCISGEICPMADPDVVNTVHYPNPLQDCLMINGRPLRRKSVFFLGFPYFEAYRSSLLNPQWAAYKYGPDLSKSISLRC